MCVKSCHRGKKDLEENFPDSTAAGIINARGVDTRGVRTVGVEMQWACGFIDMSLPENGSFVFQLGGETGKFIRFYQTQ